MAEFQEASQSLNFKDRKVRLVVFGILQIILGGICALIVSLMILEISGNAAQGDGFKAMIPAILFYILLAVWFISMGIGSIKTRRWARALILVSSWLWLICGTLGFIMMMRMIPNMFEGIVNSRRMPATAEIAVICVMLAFMTVFYIVIPALLVLFYSGRNVKATVEYRDPKVRWTDKCPLPVLAVCLVSVGWVISILWTGMIYKWAIPFFGNVLSGIPGAIVISVLALLLIYIAYGMYSLDIKAWWTALLVIVGWSLSTIITFWGIGIEGYYAKMGFSCQQMETVKQYSELLGPKMNLFFGLWAVIVIAYLLYIRGYFVKNLQKSEQV